MYRKRSLKTFFYFFLEPFRTLISEASYLAEFMQSQIVDGKEQMDLPKDVGMNSINNKKESKNFIQKLNC